MKTHKPTKEWKFTKITLCGIALFFLGGNLRAQESFENKGFVDFHSHTIMKNFYRLDHSQDVYTKPGLNNMNWTKFQPRPSKDLLGMNDVKNCDQATFLCLNEAHASIICTSLYTLEKQSISSKRIPLYAGVSWYNPLELILYPMHFFASMRLVNDWFVTKIKLKREREISQPEHSNFEELKEQLTLLEQQSKQYGNYKPVQFAETRADLDDTSKIWLVLSVEGAHNFYGNLTSDIDLIQGYKCGEAQKKEIFENLHEIKERHRLFFVTPAHLFENKMAGGGRGLDIDKPTFRELLARMMWSDAFRNAIDNKEMQGVSKDYYHLSGATHCDTLLDYSRLNATDLGWRFIDSVLDDKNNRFHKPTYIDLRHMDVMARQQYIDSIMIWNKEKYKDDPVPLIISHTAVSGKSEAVAAKFGLSPFYDRYDEFMPAEIHDFYKEYFDCIPGNDVDTFLANSGWFHPMSANLYDEEIDAVYKTNGIIGLSMEERALGKNTYNYIQHKDALKIYFSNKDSIDINDTSCPKCKLRDSLAIAEPFIRNLFYIVEHNSFYDSSDNAIRIKSWQHIALGTDFDGIMNPIDICPTSSDIPKFYNFLCRNLSEYIPYLKKDETKLFCGKTPKYLMDLLFYKNGEAFIKQYF